MILDTGMIYFEITTTYNKYYYIQATDRYEVFHHKSFLIMLSISNRPIRALLLYWKQWGGGIVLRSFFTPTQSGGSLQPLFYWKWWFPYYL